MLDITRTGQITMTRGDDISFCLFINEGDEIYPSRYNLNKDDKLYFGVIEPNKEFEEGVIRKAYKRYYSDESEENKEKYINAKFNDEGDLIIEINRKDTINLLCGDYYYEIKLEMHYKEAGKEIVDVNTIIPKTRFTIV